MGTDSEKDEFLDYYKILQCDRTASTEELKKSYQRLALTLHPDKNSGTSNSSDRFPIILKAWTILRDPESRKLYDAELSCHEHSDQLLYDTISLKDMTLDPEENVYTYMCRCGGTYVLELNDSTIDRSNVIGCDECSFSILVNLS